MNKALEPVFQDSLFRDILNSYYNMTKFSEEHELLLRYRMIHEIAERFGVMVAYANSTLYVFSTECTDVLSVTDNPDETMHDSCYAMRSASRYWLYHLPNQTEELKDAVVEYSKNTSSGGQEKNTPLLH